MLINFLAAIWWHKHVLLWYALGCSSGGVMDGWAKGKRPDTKVVKMQAVGTEALLAKATLLISKLTLKNELEVCELQSIVFRTLTLDESCDFIVQARAATKTFVEDSKVPRDSSPEGRDACLRVGGFD